MSWLQLTLECNKDHAEQLSELLEQFGAISVSLSAVSEGEIYGNGVVDVTELWERTRVCALLHVDTDMDTMLICLRDRVGINNILHHQINLIKDKDWFNEFKQGQGPLCFGDRFCICPSWCDPPADIKHHLFLDPGLAFGSGTHDTTALCLEWLVRHEIANKCVIDFGCGSGILALAALKLGADRAYAVDIDPQALRSTTANAEYNGLSEKITVSYPGETELPVSDILLANILLKPLQESASEFARLVRTGGDIILSGILAVQAEDCLAAYKTWFNMESPIFRQEWTLIQGTRK